MKLFNQTDRNLRWDLAGRAYSVGPYDSIDIATELVEHVKLRGLPLGVTAVTPEVKASITLDSANDAARKDEVASLQKQLTESSAAEALAKKELEKSLAANAQLESDLAGFSLELANSAKKLEALTADHLALNKLFEEQAKELAIKKEEAARAQAVVAEIKKAEPVKQEVKPAQNTVKNK